MSPTQWKPPLDLIEQRMNEMSHAVARASEALLSMRTGALNIRTKSNELDPVTTADLESERIIVSAIQEKFPMDGILAEEGSEGAVHRDDAEFTWVIDPLDGTVNYTHGIPLYCVAVGLMYQNIPVGGLVAVPELKDLYRAVHTRGATKNGNPIQVSTVENPIKGIVVTGFPYNRKPIINHLVEGVRNTLAQAGGIRRTGSAALDLCWVAEGRFEGFYEIYLNPWDTCASTVILREAGGRISNLQGNDYNPLNDRFVLASNGRLHDFMLKLQAHFSEVIG